MSEDLAKGWVATANIRKILDIWHITERIY